MSNSRINPLTVKRHKQALAGFIFETMDQRKCSLLEARIIVSDMLCSDEVNDIVKAKVNEYNGVKEES